jgi:hypothetical protein
MSAADGPESPGGIHNSAPKSYNAFSTWIHRIFLLIHRPEARHERDIRPWRRYPHAVLDMAVPEHVKTGEMA